MRLNSCIAFTTLALVGAAPSLSQERDPQAGFARADANGDGTLDRAEFDRLGDTRLARRAERTGEALSPEQRAKRIERRFTAMDADRSGVIDSAEWGTARARRRVN